MYLAKFVTLLSNEYVGTQYLSIEMTKFLQRAHFMWNEISVEVP